MYQDPEMNNQFENIIGSAGLFEDKKVRHGFIKKVYSLLSIQLLITVAIVALFALNDALNGWAKTNRWFPIASFSVAFVILITISCMGELRRKHIHNLIALFAFTIAESLMLAAVTVMFHTKVLMIAGGLTFVICMGLTLFALQTRYDFTTKSGIMMTVLLVALLGSILSIIYQSRATEIGISSVMAIIMGIFLVIDTQMIMGGTHKIQISPEEYIFAAINLYLDIINMFLQILTIIGHDR